MDPATSPTQKPPGLTCPGWSSFSQARFPPPSAQVRAAPATLHGTDLSACWLLKTRHQTEQAPTTQTRRSTAEHRSQKPPRQGQRPPARGGRLCAGGGQAQQGHRERETVQGPHLQARASQGTASTKTMRCKCQGEAGKGHSRAPRGAGGGRGRKGAEPKEWTSAQEVFCRRRSLKKEKRFYGHVSLGTVLFAAKHGSSAGPLRAFTVFPLPARLPKGGGRGRGASRQTLSVGEGGGRQCFVRVIDHTGLFFSPQSLSKASFPGSALGNRPLEPRRLSCILRGPRYRQSGLGDSGSGGCPQASAKAGASATHSAPLPASCSPAPGACAGLRSTTGS